jgi:hypothetical protein
MLFKANITGSRSINGITGASQAACLATAAVDMGMILSAGVWVMTRTTNIACLSEILPFDVKFLYFLQ